MHVSRFTHVTHKRRAGWFGRKRASMLGVVAATGATSLALIAGAWMFAGPARAATNLLSNPGFESAALSPWTCDAGTGSVTTTPVHSGSYSLAGAATSSDDAQCTQTVAVQPNTGYTLSGYVEGAYVYLGAIGYTENWTPSATTWQQLSTTFTTGATTTSITVYVHGWYAQGTYHADDLSLIATGSGSGSTPPPSPSASPSPSKTTTATPTPTPSSSASASASASPSPSASSTSSSGTTVDVSTGSQLSQALKSVVPGETIRLAAGTYSGQYNATISGTAGSPITLTGPSTAVITGSSVDSAYGVHLQASYWILRGFSVTTFQKGVVVDGGAHDTIDGLTVYDIGDEAIHLRAFSSNDIVENCHVHDTGKYQAGYGEGIYIGSAQSNWGTYSGGQPDTSNNDVVQNNTLGPNITAENIDIKEGTTGGLVQGNSFDATGEAGANSAVAWVDVKGNGYQVNGNTGVNAYQQGILVEQLYTGFGCGNTFKGNTLDLGSAPGYGFDIKDQTACTSNPNVVYASNNVTGGAGASTIPITPGG
ncbi:MAG TPA: carbohydrate binding domain-containing protein [Actinocrinis sp.]|uniref:carbohydrate binding domain-containing protein n=1 Tax=Actinocrinis sp. TaxID=1920516 RepID=UPI002DDD9F3B|nr:carbohydrate binding domain-containing protein [Actinocrinis sp.]HEV2345316.1 carbohydrate binding domain-containing protein [Actinocrinis sp.]